MIERLRTRFRGALLRPGEEGYDEARRVWNGAIDRRPALIARCVGADDVRTAVRFAREHELPVTVRGGGHAVAGHAVADRALMIDLSLMRAVDVDPVARTARVSGGALISDLDKATTRHGLAVTGGQISHTGVGGLTLGGGFGHLMRKLGLTVDNLLAVDLVTAEGEQLHVDADAEPELFWGLRGGGGNFGIATAFTFRLHPVGPLVLGGPIFWPLESAPEVLGLIDEWAADAPDDLGLTFVARRAPAMPILPPRHYGRPVVGLLPVWAGDLSGGERVLAPLRRLGTPLADAVQPLPYVVLQSMLDASASHGVHYYWRSLQVPRPSPDVVHTVLEAVETMTSPSSQVNGWLIGGAVSRVGADDTAIGERRPCLEFNITATWTSSDPSDLSAGDAGRHVAWVRRHWAAVRPNSRGVYTNFLSDEDAAGVASAYGTRLARLTALKDRYDPTNVFCHNANVRPSVAQSWG